MLLETTELSEVPAELAANETASVVTAMVPVFVKLFADTIAPAVVGVIADPPTVNPPAWATKETPRPRDVIVPPLLTLLPVTDAREEDVATEVEDPPSSQSEESIQAIVGADATEPAVAEEESKIPVEAALIELELTTVLLDNSALASATAVADALALNDSPVSLLFVSARAVAVAVACADAAALERN